MIRLPEKLMEGEMGVGEDRSCGNYDIHGFLHAVCQTLLVLIRADAEDV